MSTSGRDEEQESGGPPPRQQGGDEGASAPAVTGQQHRDEDNSRAESTGAGTTALLDRMIENNQWEEAYQVFEANPEESRRIFARSSSGSSLGWTKLHWLCSIGSAPPRLLRLVASQNPGAITLTDNRYGDTPLHMACRNSQTSCEKVQILLEQLRVGTSNDGDGTTGNGVGNGGTGEGVLLRNHFGGTVLHSAANHNATIGVLRLLVECNPRILRVTTHEGIHPITALWHSYVQTIPGCKKVAEILSVEDDATAPAINAEGHFERFWKKAAFLSTEYFYQSRSAPASRNSIRSNSLEEEQDDRYVLHGLLQCNVPINFVKVALRRKCRHVPDKDGNTPLHRLLEDRPYRLKEKEAVQDFVKSYPEATDQANHDGDVPLFVAIRNKIPYQQGLDALLSANRNVLRRRDGTTGLHPFQMAAATGGRYGLETTYHLLRTQPDLILRSSFFS